jgi:hypothetical protein
MLPKAKSAARGWDVVKEPEMLQASGQEYPLKFVNAEPKAMPP